MSCMNGDEASCEELEILCGGEEEEEEGFDCINSNPNAYALYMSCMNGDEASCEELEILCGSDEEEEEWENDIDALIEQLEIDCASQNDLGLSCGILEMINDCMSGNEEACEELETYYEGLDFEEEDQEDENFYEVVFPGISLLNIDSLFPNMMDDELIFIIESSEVNISIITENGITLIPEEVDGYLVFGPFDIEDVFTFLVDGLEDYILIWGFFKPMTSEVVSQGAFSIFDDVLPTIFSVSYMNLDNIKSDLIVYYTSYFDLMGRAINKPEDSGIFIKMKNTNQGVLYDKIYIQK